MNKLKSLSAAVAIAAGLAFAPAAHADVIDVVPIIPVPTIVGTDVCGPDNDIVSVDPAWLAEYGQYVDGTWIDPVWNAQHQVRGSSNIKTNLRNWTHWESWNGVPGDWTGWRVYPGTAPFIYTDKNTPCPTTPAPEPTTSTTTPAPTTTTTTTTPAPTTTTTPAPEPSTSSTTTAPPVETNSPAPSATSPAPSTSSTAAPLPVATATTETPVQPLSAEEELPYTGANAAVLAALAGGLVCGGMILVGIGRKRR